MMFLFFIVLIVSSEPVQRQLMTNFPALFNDSKTSIVATAINAAAICGMFYVMKNVKINIIE
jgi:predicted secreted protein